MSSSRKKWISYALLVCMALIVFPMNALHAHEKEEAPCHDHFELAVDACHVSIFHNATDVEQCDHKEHVVDSIEDCELCDFVTSRKMDFAAISSSSNLTIAVQQSNSDFVYEAVQQTCKATLQGRAPPVTYQG